MHLHVGLKLPSASIAGQDNPAAELLFDTVHSGQLSVRRMGRGQQPLLQMSLPLHDPTDLVPPGIAPGSDLVQVTHSMTGMHKTMLPAPDPTSGFLYKLLQSLPCYCNVL